MRKHLKVWGRKDGPQVIQQDSQTGGRGNIGTNYGIDIEILEDGRIKQE